MTAPSLLAFVGASVVLTVAPGPDNLFVIAQGICRGRRAAAITAWGMCSGITVHTLAAAAGISVIFYSSPLAFNAVKYAGAAYLLYLAFRALASDGASPGTTAPAAVTGFGHFRRGFLMNVLNPKVALFFLAFLPQFVDRGPGSIGMQMAMLGIIFMLQAFVIFSAIAWFSGGIGQRLNRHPRWPKYLSWATAAIFVGLAVRLAIASP
jgi:threonine/homoserine/homoserine lactone efflux protein